MAENTNGSPDEKTHYLSEGKGYVTMNVEPFKVTQDNSEQNDGQGDSGPQFF